jgi:hypothetical protein
MEWTNIEDALPCKDAQYLVWCLYMGEVEILTWCSHYGCWDDAEGDDHRYDTDQTTHWMPLPDPPK